MEASHRAVARNDVLDVARQQVAVVRQTVSKRRAVIEHVFFATFTLLKRCLERFILVPVVEHSAFHLGKLVAASGHIDLRVDVANHDTPPHTICRDACAARYHPAWGESPHFICGEGSDVFPFNVRF